MAATTEAKAADPKETKEISEPPLKYKTWVLRVSVHCEGCRKKVTKILKNIDGVYKTEVDMRQQKVTVTGNVEAETLIKKLTKTGKHAELWPQPNPNNNAKDKKKNKGKGKEKEQADSESPEESSHGGAAGGGGENRKIEVVQVQHSAKKNGNEGGSTSKKVDGGNSVKASEGGGAPAKTTTGGGGGGGGGGGHVKEAKPEVVGQGGNLQNQPPVVEKNGVGESDCEAEKSAGGSGAGGGASGSGGKKKKKKGQKGNAANVELDEDDHCDDDAPPSTGLPNPGNVPVGPNGPHYQHVSPFGPQYQHVSQFPHGVYGPSGPRMPPYGPHGPSFVPGPANHGLLPQQLYEHQYPRQYYRPPVQAVSYNTAYPTHGASHYATPAPNFHSYTHAPSQHLGTEMEPNPNQQYYPYHQPSYGAPPRSDSFELFSEENPNGCKIM